MANEKTASAMFDRFKNFNDEYGQNIAKAAKHLIDTGRAHWQYSTQWSSGNSQWYCVETEEMETIDLSKIKVETQPEPKLKKVYVVVGSHDGNIGVFTTVKKAWEKAVDYIEYGSDAVAEVYNGKSLMVKATYKAVCAVLKNGSIAQLEDSRDATTTARIEVFFLNLK